MLIRTVETNSENKTKTKTKTKKQNVVSEQNFQTIMIKSNLTAAVNNRDYTLNTIWLSVLLKAVFLKTKQNPVSAIENSIFRCF